MVRRRWGTTCGREEEGREEGEGGVGGRVQGLVETRRCPLAFSGQ